MIFPESALAHKYLDRLTGIEIGGSAHNPFGLNTINVDKYESMETVFKLEEFNMCGRKLPVDVVAPAWKLPFEDKSYDFVINSHVIEHCWDVIGTILEWERVARKYIFFNVPHVDRTFDSGREVTKYIELMNRYQNKLRGKEDLSNQDVHHSVWRTMDFVFVLASVWYLIRPKKFEIVEIMDVDDKVGNGFMVVVKLF